ncbi:MAG: hypothetical protein CSA35_09050 [Dethiosulfovibrio peptidovorans]|nr:MAG: hypothetical protein CSA35_09050 [Dethiosulfovibrio peptidovorans]
MPRVRVCCVQLFARDVNDRERSLKEALEAVQRASSSGGEIVVLPEAVYPGYVLDRWARDSASPDEAKQVLALFQEKARICGVYIALGLPLFRGGDWLSGAVLMDRCFLRKVSDFFGILTRG